MRVTERTGIGGVSFGHRAMVSELTVCFTVLLTEVHPPLRSGMQAQTHSTPLDGAHQHSESKTQHAAPIRANFQLPAILLRLMADFFNQSSSSLLGFLSPCMMQAC